MHYENPNKLSDSLGGARVKKRGAVFFVVFFFFVKNRTSASKFNYSATVDDLPAFTSCGAKPQHCYIQKTLTWSDGC